MLNRQCGQSCNSRSASAIASLDEQMEINAIATVPPGAVIPSRPTQVPAVNDEFIKGLIERLYEAAVIKLTPMNSYEDKTYLVETACKNGLLGRNMERYVCKITNAVDSHNGTIEAQTKLLQHLGKAGISCQQPIRNCCGKFWSLEAVEYADHEHSACEAETPRHVVRLLTYIPGELLINVPYTTELLHDIGRSLGQLHAALATFSDSVYESRNTIWSFDNATCLFEFIPYLDTIEKRQKVAEVIETFQERIKLIRNQLPSGIIHSDFNEQNILVSKISNHSFSLGHHSSEDYRVTGILDFGDSHHACYVFDLASAILYAILDSKGEFDWPDICRHITAGYLSIRTLSNTEHDVVLLCICMRLAQSLILGWYTYQLRPTVDNAYVLATQQKGWSVLDQIWLAFKNGTVGSDALC